MVDFLVGFEFAQEFLVDVVIQPVEIDCILGVCLVVFVPLRPHMRHPRWLRQTSRTKG